MSNPTSHISTSNSLRVGTSSENEFYDPEVNPAPRNTTLQIVTKGGSLIQSPWANGVGFIAWAYFPKLPDWLKKRISESYNKGKSNE
jgi:hypothetical protein